MRRSFLLGVAVLTVVMQHGFVKAHAQSIPPQQQQLQPPPTPDSLAGSVGGAWNSTTQQVQGAITAYQRVYTDLQKAEQDKANMDAYLKACGDHPGCTVPVSGAASAAPPPPHH